MRVQLRTVMDERIAAVIAGIHPETPILWERHDAAIGAESLSHNVSSYFSVGH